MTNKWHADKEAHEKYQNLSKEEKDKRLRVRYQNNREEQNQKLLEHMKDYCLVHQKVTV